MLLKRLCMRPAGDIGPGGGSGGLGPAVGRPPRPRPGRPGGRRKMRMVLSILMIDLSISFPVVHQSLPTNICTSRQFGAPSTLCTLYVNIGSGQRNWISPHYRSRKGSRKCQISSDNLQDTYTDRFGGLKPLYGDSSLEILEAAHICIVGVGGVGSWAAEALARSGVGTITLVDLDEVCISNTNRYLAFMYLGYS